MKLKYFEPWEFVPEEVFLLRGSKAIQLMDRELLIFIDTLREKLNRPITINNWKYGGPSQFRGLRTEASDVYSRFSQHPYGKALDFDVAGMFAEDVRKYLIKHRNEDWCRCITFIEDSVSWVHVDTRPMDDDILVLWDVLTKESTVYTRS